MSCGKRVLESAFIEIERAGGKLQEGAAGGESVLRHQQEPAGGVQGRHNDSAGVDDDVALDSAAVRHDGHVPLHGQVAARVDGPPLGQPLLQVHVRRAQLVQQRVHGGDSGRGTVAGGDGPASLAWRNYRGARAPGQCRPRRRDDAPAVRPGRRCSGERCQAVTGPNGRAKFVSGSKSCIRSSGTLNSSMSPGRTRYVEVHDGHDVAAGAGSVDQLLVSEVLDDFRLGVYHCRGAGNRAEGEVLRPEAHDELPTRAADRLAELRRLGNGDVRAHELGVVAGALDLDAGEVHRRAADEAGHETVDRAVVEFLRRADLLEATFVHDRDTGAHGHGFDLIVGHVDERRVEALIQAQDVCPGLDAQLGVEVGERLVHEEDRRLAHDGAPEGDALALAAGELARLAVQVAAEVQDRRRLLDAGLDLLLGDVAQLQSEGEVVADGHMRIERVALEDHRDVAVFGRDVVDDPLADPQRAGGDLFQAGDHPQARGLAAAGRPDEHHELRVSDVEVEVVDGDDVPKPLAHILKGHCCHQHDSLVSAVDVAAS